MGRHATEQRGRIFAPWIIAVAIAVVVVAVVAVGYIVVMVRANSSETGTCKSAVSLAVAVGPSAARAVTDAAVAYNETSPVVRSSCITVGVTGVGDADAITGFTERWSTRNGPQPGMWIPASAASLAALDAVRPDLTAGHPIDPFAWSPVVLAAPRSDAAALSDVSWADILSGALATAEPPQPALAPILSPVLGNRAVSYALQSALAGPDATTPVSAGTITVHTTTLRTAVAGMAEEDTTTLALGRLDRAADDGDGISVVPVVEADLVQHDLRSDSDLTAVHPHGATVGDALIGTPISATWTDRTMTAAASDFLAFLTSIRGQQILADQGWRTVSAHPTDPLTAVDTAAPVTIIPAGGPVLDEALAVALGQAEPGPTTTASPTPTTTTPPAPTSSTSVPPSTTTTTTSAPESSDLATDGPVLTLIIDTSSGMAEEDHDKSLMSWVKRALPDLIDGSVTDRIGLWVYSDAGIYPPTGSPELVPNGVITKKATVTRAADGSTNKEVRSVALTDAITDLVPDGERWAYGALMEALPKAAELARKGRENRVLLITSGADDTPGTLRRQVLEAVSAAAGDLRLDVVGLGGAVPVDAYTDIAEAGGGEYIPVLDPGKLGSQLVEFLTLGD